jgi:hypothetical protein
MGMLRVTVIPPATHTLPAMHMLRATVILPAMHTLPLTDMHPDTHMPLGIMRDPITPIATMPLGATLADIAFVITETVSAKSPDGGRR